MRTKSNSFTCRKSSARHFLAFCLFFLAILLTTSCKKEKTITNETTSLVSDPDLSQSDPHGDDYPPIKIRPAIVNQSGVLIPNIDVRIYNSQEYVTGTTNGLDTLEIEVHHEGVHTYLVIQELDTVISRIINIQAPLMQWSDTL